MTTITGPIASNGLWGEDDMVLRCACCSGGVWISEAVDWGGNPGMAIDAQGRSHIGHGGDAEGSLDQPWSVVECEILKRSVRSAAP